MWRNRFLHTEITQQIRLFWEIFDWRKDPAQDAYKPYFGKFTQHINQQVGHYFFSWFFQNLNLNYFTLDIDSSVITDTESKREQKKGYNPKKKEKQPSSYHCICERCKDGR